MKKTLIIPIVVVIAIVAILTVPGIFAKISGQHAFIEGELVECETCHPGIADQLATSTAHAGITDDGTSWALDCVMCHDVGSYQPGAHAATTMSCSECHENQDRRFWHIEIQVEGRDAKEFFGDHDYSDSGFRTPNDCGIECHSTGGDGLTGNTPEGELALGSHKEFYGAAKTSDILLHADEACIMCHTEAVTDITMMEQMLTYNAETNTFGTTPITP